jgi:flagellar hook-associated protein 1
MSTLSSLLITARDALAAQAYGLGVTGQNVANANTPLYARRQAVLETRPLGNDGTVEIKGTRQAIDVYADRQLMSSTSFGSAATEHDQQLASIEALFNDANGSGLSDSLSALFSSFQALAARPSDPTTRSAVLDKAQAFASRVQDIGNQLASTRDNLLIQAQGVVDEINSKATEIAALNRQINVAQSLGNDTADLVDRRNQTLLGLAELVDVRTVTGSNGEFLVQASGTTLVDGGISRVFDIELAAGGNMQLLIRHAEGQAGSEVTQFLTGGKLAGIFETRDVDLAETAERFDQFVYDVATAVNTQHALGFGSDGQDGRFLFAVTAAAEGAARALTLSSDVAGQPDRVAAAASAAEVPGGSGNALLLAALGSTPVAFGSTRTPGQAYADIVGEIGLRKSAAENESSMREVMQAQAEAYRDSTSGVSLDEEMVSLSQYQRAYQAASKVLTTVDELLGELMARVGG